MKGGSTIALLIKSFKTPGSDETSIALEAASGATVSCVGAALGVDKLPLGMTGGSLLGNRFNQPLFTDDPEKCLLL